MKRHNDILLIEAEEDIRLGAKAFLASEGLFIDTVSSRLDKDMSAYSLVIEGGYKKADYLDAIFLQKPYAASELLRVIVDRGFNGSGIKP